jgi:hypothetical protein
MRTLGLSDCLAICQCADRVRWQLFAFSISESNRCPRLAHSFNVQFHRRQLRLLGLHSSPCLPIPHLPSSSFSPGHMARASMRAPPAAEAPQRSSLGVRCCCAKSSPALHPVCRLPAPGRLSDDTARRCRLQRRSRARASPWPRHRCRSALRRSLLQGLLHCSWGVEVPLCSLGRRASDARAAQDSARTVLSSLCKRQDHRCDHPARRSLLIGGGLQIDWCIFTWEQGGMQAFAGCEPEQILDSKI